MSEYVTLKAEDGHELNAYIARPAGKPIAALVVVQEIFGVNAHIRSVADGYAKDGFLAVAPALFDRIERNVELGYEGADSQKAMALYAKLNLEQSLQDVAAALDFVHIESGAKAGVIGYCYGGSLAWLAATRLHPEAAVGYYGGQITNYTDERPSAPVMLHFGKLDKHIPAEVADRVHAANPAVEIYWYDAGHGFNCEPRRSFDAPSAKLARERSLSFLKSHLA
jgi:carboxymethylenebutenolidase